jgi:hypothetical protein
MADQGMNVKSTIAMWGEAICELPVSMGGQETIDKFGVQTITPPHFIQLKENNTINHLKYLLYRMAEILSALVLHEIWNGANLGDRKIPCGAA